MNALRLLPVLVVVAVGVGSGAHLLRRSHQPLQFLLDLQPTIKTESSDRQRWVFTQPQDFVFAEMKKHGDVAGVWDGEHGSGTIWIVDSTEIRAWDSLPGVQNVPTVLYVYKSQGDGLGNMPLLRQEPSKIPRL